MEGGGKQDIEDNLKIIFLNKIRYCDPTFELSGYTKTYIVTPN